MFRSVCQQGGSIWQTVYKTEASESTSTEEYWDVVFIGIPIPVKRTKSTTHVRLNHYKRVYRCNGTVSDWELVATSNYGDFDGGTVTHAFGLFEWSAENQQAAADYSVGNITAKVRLPGSSGKTKPSGNASPRPSESGEHDSKTISEEVNKPKLAKDHGELAEIPISDIRVPYHPEFRENEQKDPEKLWVANKDLWGWVDAIEDPTIFKPYYDANSNVTYMIKEGSIMRKADLPPQVASQLSGIPDWIEIVDVRLAPRTESLKHNEFAGPLVNIALTFREFSQQSTAE